MLEKIKELISGARAFFILRVSLSIPVGLIGGRYTKEVTAILTENLPPRTILVLVTMSMTLTALTMLFYGKRVPTKKVNNFLYENIIYYLTKLGRSLSSACIGILTGLLIATFVYWELKISIEIIVMIVTLVIYWVLFCLVDFCAEKGLGETISIKYQRIVLVFIFIATPSVYVLLN
ncbi:hypothetical protein [Xenorhabdus siamensis]|uniref:hypothetical protein n=1 Tax=Xenorhabdus siamensis TaxID=3136254 RepID=UPI0030F3D696